MLPLLIGQSPGPNTSPEFPLYPIPSWCAGGRLMKIMGLTRGQYLKTFDRMNLLPYFPGQHQHGDKFPMAPAKLAAAVVRPLLSDRTVILIGRSVANAFGFDSVSLFHVWCDYQVRRRCLGQPYKMRFAIVPHPSGRNHWYNGPENLAQAQAFWAEFLAPK